jgi:hypothetical protein
MKFLSGEPMVATTRSLYGYMGENPLKGVDRYGACP